jgi:hypothetical protein
MLETFDEIVINNLKEGMEVRCGFGHKTREYTKDGKTMIINDIRLYKIESVHKEQPAGHAEGQQQGATPAPQQQGGGETDDLPF